MIRGILVGSIVLFVVYLLQTFIFGLLIQKNEVSPKQKRWALIWGAVGAAILSSLFQIPIMIFLQTIIAKSKAATIWAIFIAPITEEVSKGLAPAYFAYRFKQYNWRILAYVGAISGLGFFLTETFLAFIQPDISKARLVQEITIRGIALSLMHPLAVMFTGIGISLFFNINNRKARYAATCAAFLMAFGIHFFNNAAGILINQGKKIDQTDQIPTHLAILLGLLILAKVHIYSRKAREQNSPIRE